MMRNDYTKETAHEEIDHIFCDLFPRKGMAQRTEQIKLSHMMFDSMLEHRIALCDAGTGIGKTYAYPGRNCHDRMGLRCAACSCCVD